MPNDLTSRVRAARQQGKPGASVDVVQQKVSTLRQVIESPAMGKEFAKALPQHIPAQMFIRAALTCVQKTPALLDCTTESFLGALMASAALGLMPGTKEMALVPYGRTCTAIPQWQGLVVLMYRSDRVESVIADFIHENDDWFYVPSRRPPDDFHHAPAKTGRGEITHAYAYAWLRTADGKPAGRSRVSLLSEDDGVYIRNRFSKVYAQAESNGRRNSFWHTDFWPAVRKSAVRRIADYVPTSSELREYLANAVAEDDDGVSAEYRPPVPPRPVTAPEPVMLQGPAGDVQVGEIVEEPGQDRQVRTEATAQGGPGADNVTVAPDARLPREEMRALFDEFFPGVSRPDLYALLSAFTGRKISRQNDLADSDVSDIIDAFAVASSEDNDKDATARRFRDMASFADANAQLDPDQGTEGTTT